MEDQVVDLVVSMDRISSILRLRFRVPEECQHLIDMRYLSNGNIRFYIHCCGLCPGDCGEGFDLSIVEAIRFAIILQPNIFGIDAVELGKSSNGVVPPVLN
jgi:hypothetical protein